METKFTGSRTGLALVGDSESSTTSGVRVGTFTGYATTWERDEVGDRFERGAFAKSLAEHRSRGQRPIRLRLQHELPVGMIPIESVREDSTGLLVFGKVNLSTRWGHDAWAMIQQGALSDLSVGYTVTRYRHEGSTRVITEARLWEVSVVDEPANRTARILRVEAASAEAPPRRDEASLMRDMMRNLDGARRSMMPEPDQLREMLRDLNHTIGILRH